MANYIGWNKKRIEKLVNDVYDGKVTRERLPKPLYKAIKGVLTKEVEKGFNIGDLTGESTSILLDSFKANISVFSAAKTYQQVNDMSNFVMSDGGTKLPFADFKAAADEIFDTYNGVWLKTEQDTAFALAQSAANWVQIEEQAEALPILTFQTVGDARVRAEHAEYDGITLPFDDPFWDDNYPPLDWNCRCIVTQHAEDEKSVTTKAELDDLDLPEVPELFKGNPAKDGYIFDEDAHPYFKVADKYSKDNYGLD